MGLKTDQQPRSVALGQALLTIVVTGQSIEELTARAKEAIHIYWENLRAEQSPTSTRREIEVELPV